MLPAVPHRAAAKTRRRLRAGHRAEPVALQVSLPSLSRALLCLAVVSCVAELRFAADTHSAEHAPSSQGPAFFGRESCEHKPSSCTLPRLPSPCRCPLPSACRRCCAIATAVPPTFYPHTLTPGRGPVLPGRTCARALTHTRGRSPAYVPNQRHRAVPRRLPFLCSLA
jgi:hypothetical protein